jgi:hypothetical protein
MLMDYLRVGPLMVMLGFDAVSPGAQQVRPVEIDGPIVG